MTESLLGVVPPGQDTDCDSAAATAFPKSVLELQYSAYRDEALERLKMQEGLAQATFRSLILANGGAIIALFTLIGSNAAFVRHAPGLTLWLACATFGAGLAATILSNVAGFAMQIHYSTMTERQMWNKELELAGRLPTHDVSTCLVAGDWWQKAGVSCVVLSLVFFTLGVVLCFVSLLAR